VCGVWFVYVVCGVFVGGVYVGSFCLRLWCLQCVRCYERRIFVCVFCVVVCL